MAQEKETHAESPIGPGDAESFFKVVEARHSVRRYTEDEIPHEDLVKIFKAVRLAPSANNLQPWRFVVVRDEETKKLLAQPSPQRFIADASVIVAVLGQTGGCCSRSPLTWPTRDPIIATEHLVLAATALGYGSCWIAVYESRPQEWLDEVRGRLKVPDNAHVICLVALGIPAGPSKPTPRKDLGEFVFLEEYGKPLTG
jgi:nitroreductase